MRSLLGEQVPLVLAVSGGLDSMVLLDAIGRAIDGAERTRVVVASFDHGTGGHATRAVAEVKRASLCWGLRCVAERIGTPVVGEARWRTARWRFLRRVALETGGVVVTAHTRDDHLETIVMRILRGAGARGLSALRAPSPIRRPLLAFSRGEITEYATAAGAAWIDDPSNDDRSYLRNRVRHDLLPALRAARPSLERELLALAERATALREACTEVVRPLVIDARPDRVLARVVTDSTWPPQARALLCQTAAEFGGLSLDWRGTERLALYSAEGRAGTRIPLSGGFEAVHRGDAIELRRRPPTAPASASLHPERETRFGAWRFFRIPVDTLFEDENDADPWRAWIPSGRTVEVRAWRDGDRMKSSGSGLRRVKRFLSDKRVAAADRQGWPVVVADGEIVWIPGVRRVRAATARSGRPRVCFVCERVYS